MSANLLEEGRVSAARIAGVVLTSLDGRTLAKRDVAGGAAFLLDMPATAAASVIDGLALFGFLRRTLYADPETGRNVVGIAAAETAAPPQSIVDAAEFAAGAELAGQALTAGAADWRAAAS